MDLNTLLRLFSLGRVVQNVVSNLRDRGRQNVTKAVLDAVDEQITNGTLHESIKADGFEGLVNQVLDAHPDVHGTSAYPASATPASPKETSGKKTVKKNGGKK